MSNDFTISDRDLQRIHTIENIQELLDDLKNAIHNLDNALPTLFWPDLKTRHKKYKTWKERYPQAFIVLIEMTYQLGLEGVERFRNTLSAMANEDFETAAAEMLDSKWAIQTPERAQSLSATVGALAKLNYNDHTVIEHARRLHKLTEDIEIAIRNGEYSDQLLCSIEDNAYILVDHARR